MKSKFQSKEELEALLQRFSVEEIAKECGCTTKTVYVSMARLKITRPKKREWSSGKKHWHWKGGTFEDGNGYRRVSMPEHPEADMNGYVLEHRLVMEQKLGRRLRSGEQVHHINRIRIDNRPDNLILIFKQAHHIQNECPRCGYKWLTH